MEQSMPMSPSPALNLPAEERRHTREDGWARALRYIVMATYVLLIINVFVFIGVASSDFNRSMAEQFKGPAAAPCPSHAGYLCAYVPIMVAGLFVGLVGALIHRKRTRRRRDRHYGGQLLCVFVSVVGLALFFILT